MTNNLFTIYGGHKAGDCPLYNQQNAKTAVAASDEIATSAKRYKIQEIVGKYHTSEHNIVWIVRADSSDLVKGFFIDLGLAEYNAIKVVPMTTFESIAQGAQKLIEQ